ncbi:MAG TPA: Hsp20/alpha crystallin family protein [Actinomycetota bacterium]|nr:Hsp20/alpha crystallin family protein [Actinomycetota bacterium]
MVRHIRRTGDGSDHLERHFEEVIDHLLRQSGPRSRRRTWAPNVDVYDCPEEYVVVVDLAGIDPERVTVEVDQNDVAIMGERGLPADRVNGCREGAPLQLEIPFGAFERRLRLPQPIDSSASKATMDSGLLTIRFRKVPRIAKRVQIESPKGPGIAG